MSVDINICIFICQYKQIWCRSNKVIKSNHIFTFLIPFPSTPCSHSFPLYCTQKLNEVWGSRNHSLRPPWAFSHAAVYWQVITTEKGVTSFRVPRGQWGELCFVSRELKVGSVILNEPYTEVVNLKMPVCLPCTTLHSLTVLAASQCRWRPRRPGFGSLRGRGMETRAKRKLELFQ